MTLPSPEPETQGLRMEPRAHCSSTRRTLSSIPTPATSHSTTSSIQMPDSVPASAPSSSSSPTGLYWSPNRGTRWAGRQMPDRFSISLPPRVPCSPPSKDRTGDQVGSMGVTFLNYQDWYNNVYLEEPLVNDTTKAYLISSPDWDNGAGAVTWVAANSTVSGVLSSSNSLVGSTAGDA